MYKEIGSVISARRRELGINQAELAARLAAMDMAVTNQAVSKWENGSTMPNAKQFLALCDVLEIDDIRACFSGKSQGILAGLDRDGRLKALDYIRLLKESGRYTVQEEKIVKLRSLPLYALPVSAGTGHFLDSEDYEMVEVGNEVPDGVNFGVRVSGDSMEPEFINGQTVWVRQQRSLMTGEIGIFLYDGNAYLKQLVAVDGALALHSLNSEYKDIIISPELPLRVLGKVLR